MGAKQIRHEAIRRIVRSSRPGTQAELAALLAAEGFTVTQTTVSRDLAELEMRKAPDGRYELAEDLYLQRMCRDLVLSVERTGNLVLVKTSAGTAQGVAAALDAASPRGVLGSVAGDDTILVVARDNDSAKATLSTLRQLSERRRSV